jgi:hypothetical protein
MIPIKNRIFQELLPTAEATLFYQKNPRRKVFNAFLGCLLIYYYLCKVSLQSKTRRRADNVGRTFTRTMSGEVLSDKHLSTPFPYRIINS